MVIAVLSSVVLFTMSQYINIGKDSNLAGTLSSLIPAGEIFYSGNSNSYNNEDSGISFCNPNQNSVLRNVISQMPQAITTDCYDSNMNPASWGPILNPAGLCCHASASAWVAFARLFVNNNEIYCVDSRGVRKNTDASEIYNITTAFRCFP